MELELNTSEQIPVSPLTSDVLHGDGTGGGEFPRHPESFVAKLLVNQRPFEEEREEDLAHIEPFKKPLRCIHNPQTVSNSPPSLAVFSSKCTEYKEKIATATRRILQTDNNNCYPRIDSIDQTD